MEQDDLIFYSIVDLTIKLVIRKVKKDNGHIDATRQWVAQCVEPRNVSRWVSDEVCTSRRIGYGYWPLPLMVVLRNINSVTDIWVDVIGLDKSINEMTALVGVQVSVDTPHLDQPIIMCLPCVKQWTQCGFPSRGLSRLLHLCLYFRHCRLLASVDGLLCEY